MRIHGNIKKWSRLIALFLIGIILQSCLSIYLPGRWAERSLLAQTPTELTQKPGFFTQLPERSPTSAARNPVSLSCPTPAKPLKVQEKRYAEVAWQYFESNYESSTGLVPDRHNSTTVTMWGMGDYLAALVAARSLDILSPTQFDALTQLLLGSLTKLPLFANELPSRYYDIHSLQPVDNAGNPVPLGTGWSAVDIGRLLTALYNLKSCHPEYTEAVDRIVLNWSYLPIVRQGRLFSAEARQNETQVTAENHLG